MTIDISGLNAQELERLILDASERRSQLEPKIQANAPTKFHALEGPRWYSFRNGEYTILQLRHPGLGWLAFALPAPSRAHLLRLLLDQQLLEPADAPAPADPR